MVSRSTTSYELAAGLECQQASLQIQNARVIIQNFESKLLAKKMEMDGIRSLMEAASQMARATDNWDIWQRLFQQHETCQQEMRTLNAEHEALKDKMEVVHIPSLAGLKRPPVRDDDECPIKEISTEERSSSAACSQLSSPMSNMYRVAKQSKK